RHAESAMCGAGEPVSGANLSPWGKWRRASSFSASPSANSAGVRKRLLTRADKSLLLAVLVLTCACLLPAVAFGQTSVPPNGTTPGPAPSTGGTSPTDPQFQPAPKAKIVNGLAIPPIGAPQEVVDAINAANEIVTKPYIYGGGHKSFNAKGYDCSGSV